MSFETHRDMSFRAVRMRLRNPENAVEDRPIELRHPRGINGYEVAKLKVEKPVNSGISANSADNPITLIEAPAPQSIPGSDIRTMADLYTAEELLPKLTIRRIQAAVCEVFRVSLVDLIGNRRTKFVIMPRHVAVWFSRKFTIKSFPEIGHQFGGRDHTTMLHAYQKVDAKRHMDTELAEKMAAIAKILGVRISSNEK